MKMLKRTITLFLALAMLISLTACGERLLENDEYFVEYGQSYNERPSGQFEIVVKDGNGKEVKTRYGVFTPAIGEYTATYTSEKGKQTVKIVCKDTKGPTITFDGTYNNSVTAGERANLPEYRADDISGVKKESVKVVDKDGAEIPVTGGSFMTEQNVYTVTVTAEDNQGNVSEKSVTVYAREDYIDTEKADNCLFSFDNEKYINLVRNRSGKTAFSPSIIFSGYPTLENDKEENGVLELSTDIEYGNAYSELCSYDPIYAKDATKIYARVAANKDTEWIKITDKEENVAGSVHRVKGGEWYVIEILPIDFGYGNPVSGFMIYARADEGLTLWVDEIWADKSWKDETLGKDVIARFDDERYVPKMYQNIYNKNDYSAGGSTFEVTDYPADTNKKVMKVTTSKTFGGFTYMFDESIKLEEIESITIKLDCSLPCENLWLGAMQGTFRNGASYSGLFNYGDKTAWQYIEFGKMNEITVTPEAFWSRSCPDGVLTGIWVSVVDKQYDGNVLYIEEITVARKPDVKA